MKGNTKVTYSVSVSFAFDSWYGALTAYNAHGLL